MNQVLQKSKMRQFFIFCTLGVWTFNPVIATAQSYTSKPKTFSSSTKHPSQKIKYRRWNYEGLQYADQEDLRQAELDFQKSLEFDRKRLPQSDMSYARNLISQAKVALVQRRYDRAFDLYQQCRKRVMSACTNSGSFSLKFETFLETCLHLDDVGTQLDRDAEVELVYQKLYIACSQTNLVEEKAKALNAIGVFYKRDKRFKESEAAFVESLRVQKRSAGNLTQTLIDSQTHLIVMYREAGLEEKGFTLCEALLTRLLKERGVNDQNTIYILEEFVFLATSLKRFSAARDAELLVHNYYEETTGLSSSERVTTAYRLVQLHDRLTHLLAEHSFNEQDVACKGLKVIYSKKSLAASLQQEKSLLVEWMIECAAHYYQKNMNAEAEIFMRRSLTLCEELFGKTASSTIATCTVLAKSYGVNHRQKLSIRFANRVLNYHEQFKPSNSIQIERMHQTLGLMLAEQDQYIKAEQLLIGAHKNLEKLGDQTQLGFSHSILCNLYLRMNDFEKATKHAREAVLLLNERDNISELDKTNIIGNLACALEGGHNFSLAEEQKLKYFGRYVNNSCNRGAASHINYLIDRLKTDEKTSAILKEWSSHPKSAIIPALVCEYEERKDKLGADDGLTGEILVLISGRLSELQCSTRGSTAILHKTWKAFASKLLEAVQEKNSGDLENSVSHYISHYENKTKACTAAFHSCMGTAWLLHSNEPFAGKQERQFLQQAAREMIDIADSLAPFSSSSTAEIMQRYMEISALQEACGEFSHARFSIERALSFADTGDNSSEGVQLAKIQLAGLLYKQKDFERAIHAAEAVNLTIRNNQSEYKQLKLLSILSNCTIKKAERYLKTKQSVLAEESYLKAKKLAEECLSLETRQSSCTDSERLKSKITLARAIIGLFENRHKRADTISRSGGTRFEEADYAELSKTIEDLKSELVNIEKLTDGELSYSLMALYLQTLAEAELAKARTITSESSRHMLIESAQLYFSKAFVKLSANPTTNEFDSIIKALQGMAITDAMLNGCENSDRAQDYALEAADFIDAYVADAFPTLSFAEQREFLTIVRDEMDILLSVCNDDEQFRKAYTHFISWRGFLIESLRNQTAALASAKVNQLTSNDANELEATKRLLVGLLQSSDSPNLADIDTVTLSKEKFERKILSTSQKLHLLVDPVDTLSKTAQSVDSNLVSELCKLLHPEECLIDLYRYKPIIDSKPHYAAALLSQDKALPLTLVDLGDADKIDEAINEWLQYSTPLRAAKRDVRVESSETNRRDDANAEGELAWEKLQKLIWAPLSLKIQKYNFKPTKFSICDESHLARIPWCLFTSASSGSIETEDTLMSGAAKTLTCRLDSPRELIRLRSKSALPRPLASQKILIVGDIKFNNELTPPLPGAALEVKELERLARVKQLDCTVRSKGEPTLSVVKDLIQECAVAHFATHGYFADIRETGTENSNQKRWQQVASRSPLIDSGIILAPAELAGRVARKRIKLRSAGKKPAIERTLRDGIPPSGESLFTAEDIIGLKLTSCDLVTLSACETGRGDEESGQGVLGLRSAFMASGVNSVLMSLWSVDDDATRFFMSKFYEYLWSGHSKASALDLAQHDVRSEKNHPQWKEPKYWAAWVLVGNAW